jgi:hypothetical protein
MYSLLNQIGGQPALDCSWKNPEKYKKIHGRTLKNTKIHRYLTNFANKIKQQNKHYFLQHIKNIAEFSIINPKKNPN